MQTALKEQHARYADIRKRLMGTPVRPVVAQKPRQEEIAIDVLPQPNPISHSALQEQHLIWKAARERLFKTPAKDGVQKEQIVRPSPMPRHWPPREPVDHNAHVKAYERRLMEEAINPVAVYMKDRSDELGVTYPEVIGGSRRKVTSEPRHWMMWEVLKRFGCSFPALGRHFGGRDHTTCLYAVRKIDGMIADGRLQVSYDGKIFIPRTAAE